MLVGGAATAMIGIVPGVHAQTADSDVAQQAVGVELATQQEVVIQRAMPPPIFVTFVAGTTGMWQVDHVSPVTGETLTTTARLTVVEGSGAAPPPEAAWALRGVTSNPRYTNRVELNAMGAVQEGLLRPQATRAALIPIRKTEAWWALAQDERREILEAQSRHIAIGLEYLPAVARRLYHSRDLGESFDFLTWFEYAPEHAADFEELVRRLRQTAEWAYVDREVDIRLSR